MKVEIKPFTENMIPEAGNLLARRHKRNRASLPLLPVRFEDTQVAVKAVQALWQVKFKNGYAAFRDGKMVAYLLGDFTVQPWGRCGYVYLPGYALAGGESIATMRTVCLSVAATKPQARGRGISTALTWWGLSQTRKDGFDICYTNWISPNLLASRFWPRFGFKDVAYRLSKRVDPMITWAKG